MDNKLTFIILLLLALIGVTFGLSVFSGGGSLLASTFGSNSNLLASVSMINSPEQDAGRFLISYDNLKNIFPIRVGDEKNLVTVIDVDVNTNTSPDTIYVSTNKGLYFSKDSGLTWHVFISSHNEINADSMILKVLPVLGKEHAYYISVFSQGQGVVYYTADDFFTLTKLADFRNEGAYELMFYGSHLYMGMSNGQLLRYDTAKQTFNVVTVFGSPIHKFYDATDGYLYLQLKSGALLRASSPEGEFLKVRIPGGGLLSFSGSKVDTFDYDKAGNIYVLTSNGLFRSSNSGVSFTFIRDIPLLTEKIDAFAVENGTIYLVSAQRLYTTTDGGVEWKFRDLTNNFRINTFFFMGNGRVVMSS